MTVESLSLPFVRARLRTPIGAEPLLLDSELLDLDRLEAAQAEAVARRDARALRHRVAIAVAASGIFFTGVGSLFMHVAMPMPSSAAMSSQMSSQMSTGAMSGEAMRRALVPSAAPAVPVQVTGPVADSGPPHPLGRGTAVSTTASKSAATTASGTSASSSAGHSSSSASSTSGAGTSGSGSSGSSTRSSTLAYSVRTGDDFGAIAARFGVSPQRIAALNPGVTPTSLSIGQTLRVP